MLIVGIGLQEMNSELAEKFGGHRGEGVLVAKVFPDTPASAAGFETGDIITKVDGREGGGSSNDLPRIVGSIKPGTKATLQVFRRGSTRDLNVVVSRARAGDASSRAARPTRRRRSRRS